MSNNTPDSELSAKEMAIAKRAAELAVQQITDEFYQSVGRTVITRIFIIIGAAFVGLVIGKGWISKILG